MATTLHNDETVDHLMWFRDFAVLLLSFGAVHIGMNMLSSDTAPVCPYDSPTGFAVSCVVFLSYVSLLVARSNGWRHTSTAAWVVDIVCFAPGIWYQITTKPDGGWFAAVPSDGCSMRESGYAYGLWSLGEMLTFGAGLRAAIALDFGRQWLNTALVVVAAFAMQFATGVFATALQRVY